MAAMNVAGGSVFVFSRTNALQVNSKRPERVKLWEKQLQVFFYDVFRCITKAVITAKWNGSGAV